MQRDFVVQIRPDADLSSGQFRGRIEHMDSGAAVHFHTAEELLAFIARSCAPSMPLAAASSKTPANS